MSIIPIIKKIPDLPQHIILEFLGYKRRNGKYMKQFPKNMYIHKLIQEKSDVIYKNSEYVISIDIKFRFYHNYFIVKTIMIYYDPNDRNNSICIINDYSVDFDGSRHIIYFDNGL